MYAFAWFATVLADHDMPVIVTLDFRARNATQTNEAKTTQHAFRSKMRGEKFFIAQAVLQGEEHRPLMQKRGDKIDEIGVGNRLDGDQNQIARADFLR